MADDSKRDNNLCVKATDRMVLAISRHCALLDIKPSEYLYELIRRDLFGRDDATQQRLGKITDAASES